MEIGIEFISGTAVEALKIGIRRWPSIRTRVRGGPRLRKPTCERPLAPLLVALVMPAVLSGPTSLVSTSSALNVAVNWICSGVAVEVGLGLIALATGMREPVSTT